MTEKIGEGNSPFERRTKRLFDDSTAVLDAATRSRLTRARHEALGQRVPSARRWPLLWVPAGAVAAAAAFAWVVVWQPSPAPDAGLRAAPLGDLEILLAEEDLELLDEEIEFYGWLEEQPELAGGGDNVG